MNRPVMGVLVVVVALLAACGAPGAPAKPPTAQEVLAKPSHASNLKDGHFLAAGTFTSQGVSVEVNGDGEVVYKSPTAGRFKFQTTVAGQQVSFEEITINGTDYTFTSPGNGKWTSKTSTSGLGPESFSGASGFKYIGEENLAQGKCWHASAKDKDGNPFDGWIRESDGYPVKYVLTQPGASAAGNTLTLTFDKYNTGATISAPPSSQVVPG